MSLKQILFCLNSSLIWSEHAGHVLASYTYTAGQFTWINQPAVRCYIDVHVHDSMVCSWECESGFSLSNVETDKINIRSSSKASVS